MRSDRTSTASPASRDASAVSPVSWAPTGIHDSFWNTSSAGGPGTEPMSSWFWNAATKPCRQRDRVGVGRCDPVGLGEHDEPDPVRCEQAAGPQGRSVGDQLQGADHRFVALGLGHDEPVGEVERSGVDDGVGDARGELAAGHGQHPGVADVEHAVVADRGVDGQERVEERGEGRVGRVPGAVTDRDHAGHEADDDRDVAEDADRLPPAEPPVEHVGAEATGHCGGAQGEAERDRHGQQ